jgi:hypothetical protein
VFGLVIQLSGAFGANMSDEYKDTPYFNAYEEGFTAGHAAAIAEIKAKFPSEDQIKMACLSAELFSDSNAGHQYRMLGWQLCYDYLKQKLFGEGGE